MPDRALFSYTFIHPIAERSVLGNLISRSRISHPDSRPQEPAGLEVAARVTGILLHG
jgi:hypothetical protein